MSRERKETPGPSTERKSPPRPPPKGGEKREHPRCELFAQVQVSRGGEVYIMSTQNVSLGGVFIQGEPVDHPEVTIGAELELVIFPVEQLSDEVRCRAKVVRIEVEGSAGAGFGLKFLDVDADNRGRLQRFIGGPT